MYCIRHIQNPTKFRTLSLILNSDISRHIHFLFRHIKPYRGIFRTLCNSCIFRDLSYSGSRHTWNLKYVQNSVKTYSGIFRTLCNARTLRTLLYLELCHIQNFGIFQTKGIFRTLSNI